jgi:hypothetical protein
VAVRALTSSWRGGWPQEASLLLTPLDLLRAQFGEIWIPNAVQAELADVPDGAVRTTIDQSRQVGWLKGQAASDANLVNLLTLELRRGEAQAIALALEMKADWLLMMSERVGPWPGNSACM